MPCFDLSEDFIVEIVSQSLTKSHFEERNRPKRLHEILLSNLQYKLYRGIMQDIFRELVEGYFEYYNAHFKT